VHIKQYCIVDVAKYDRCITLAVVIYCRRLHFLWRLAIVIISSKTGGKFLVVSIYVQCTLKYE